MVWSIWSCQDTSVGQQSESPHAKTDSFVHHLRAIDTARAVLPVWKPIDTTRLAPDAWVRLADVDSSFAYDIRYASAQNAFGLPLYPCANCLLRWDAARALIRANAQLRAQGYRLRLFDCYRPLSVSHRMWQLVPNPTYVKNPNRGPSMHNRGTAVDLSIETLDGQLLDMGTDFDFFGPAAHHTYTQLPEVVLANRWRLKQTMAKHGFRAIRSEWWHYSYQRAYPASNHPWSCP